MLPPKTLGKEPPKAGKKGLMWGEFHKLNGNFVSNFGISLPNILGSDKWTKLR